VQGGWSRGFEVARKQRFFLAFHDISSGIRVFVKEGSRSIHSVATETEAKEKPKVRLRCYSGARDIVTVYYPDDEKEKIYYIDQKWLEPIFDYCVKHGAKRIETRWGYSRILRARIPFETYVWEAEIDADKLLDLIMSNPTWHRSDHARNIVEKLKELIRSG
jgi:hypothetical protein